MMTLFDLPPHPRHRRTDPDTSKHAARSVSPRTEQLIEAIFAGGGRFTDDELADALRDHYKPTVVSARSRLAKRGVLKDSGQRRLSARGREQVVWMKK